MATFAASISSAKPAAAVTLRCDDVAAASASPIAVSRYSTARATSGGRMNAAASLCPGNHLGKAGVDFRQASMNFRRPGGLGVSIYFTVEALDQFTRDSRALLVREPQGLGKQPFWNP